MTEQEPPRAHPPPPPPPPPPPYPPPHAPRSFVGWWVSLAAVVVLGVGTATALVVVQPWDDDRADRDRDTSAGTPPGSEEPDLAEPSELPTVLPTDLPSATPTAPPTTTAPTQPSPVDLVTGDLDGDGYGDAAAVVGRDGDIERYFLASTGRSFKVGRVRLADYEDRTWADFDGDGALDLVSWTYQLDGTLALTSEDLDFQRLELPLRLDEGQPYVTLKPGDVDGDGAVDLVGYGATGSRAVSVWVLRNNGYGFDEPQVWARLRDVAPGAQRRQLAYSYTSLLPGDLTGDGLVDVLVRRPTGPGEYGFALLTSTGEAFRSGRLQRPGDFADGAELVIGDFAGDGTPVLMLIGPSGRRGVGVRVEGLRWSGTRLVSDHRWDANLGGAPSVAGAAVSDVDGDGRDDVVYTASPGATGLDGFRVIRSTGARFRASEVWARTPPCEAAIDCVFYFQNSS